MGLDTQELLKQELEKLRNEHSEIDRKIKKISHEAVFNQIAVQKLKKEKLALKDKIERIRSNLLPDIIA